MKCNSSYCTASCGLYRVRVRCMSALLEVVVVLLAALIAIPPFPITTKQGVCLSYSVLASCQWALACKHGGGPAHFGGSLRYVCTTPFRRGLVLACL